MKIRLNQGFHGGAGANILDGWQQWHESQNNAGVKVNAIFTDNAGPLFEIQENNFNDNVLVYRTSLVHNGFDPNTPDYNARPEDEAVRMLSYKFTNLWPPELNKNIVWYKDTNEIRTQTNPGDTWYQNLKPGEWWGRYGITAVGYAITNNVKVILFSPSSGDWDNEFWEQPSMLQCLALCAKHRENVMIGLHEYSFVAGNLFATILQDNSTVEEVLETPFWNRKIGRFEWLFQICDDHNIDWPTLYFCEWGWALDDMPDASLAMSQILDALVDIYGGYYNYIGGFGCWYLGISDRFGRGIAEKTNALLEPCANAAIKYEWEIEEKKPEGTMPEETLHEHLQRVAKEAQTVSYNQDAALQKAGNRDGYGITGSETRTEFEGVKYAVQPFGDLSNDAERYYYSIVNEWGNIKHGNLRGDDMPSDKFRFTHWPTNHKVVTQRFRANPDDYAQFNLDGHEGTDVRAYFNDPVYAVADGVVSNRHDSATGHNYGRFIRIAHKDGYETTYAHLNSLVSLTLGTAVKGGETIGYADSTGNSTGSHLHLTLKKTNGNYPDRCGTLWPYNIVDSDEFLQRFSDVTWPPIVECKDDPPPSEPKRDLLPYLKGDGRLYEVRNSAGSQERFQTKSDGHDFWQTKNSLAEQLSFDGSYLYRGWDISPGGNRFYIQQEPKGAEYAKWLPRNMAVDETFTVSLWVQYYNWDCSEISEKPTGAVTDTRKFVAHFDTWTSRAGITLDDVIQIEWVNGGEVYFYARDFGLVGWERSHQDPNTPQWSAISEIHEPGQRPDNVINMPDCL